MFNEPPAMTSRLSRFSKTSIGSLCTVILLLVLAGCDSDKNPEPGLFTLNASSDVYTLQEGDATGVDIPFDITRTEGYTSDVSLSLSGFSPNDVSFVTSRFNSTTLTPSADQGSVNIKLDVGALPILAQQRNFQLSAMDGSTTQNHTITVNVVPVDAPDVYLLAGQSNMVGFGGDGDKDAGPGGADEPDDRILQLNVTQNNETDVFTNAAAWTNTSTIALLPYIVRAEDPLHIPLDPNTLAKEDDYIGLGLSFAKNALPNTSKNIILVPTAYSSSAFCRASIIGANWNSEEPANSSLGNTLLYDRAVARTNLALQQSGGILRGILWHQGESDADGAFTDCAATYEANLTKLAANLRTDIMTDARGSTARGADANIPLVVGTMSRGISPAGDFSILFEEKQIIDTVHRSVETLIPHAALSNHDDLVPTAYPCGNDSCIHFGSAALRVMGGRYYDALVRAALQ